MAKVYKTPGVYIQELNAFPNSIAQVETAIPAFIGYTEKAERGNGESLLNIPTRISSLLEYVELFGEAFMTKYSLSRKTKDPQNPDKHLITINGVERSLSCNENHNFYMYRSLQLFYSNGGSNCYIVSVGTYGDEPEGLEINKAALLGESLTQDGEIIHGGLKALTQKLEPTMILVPDAVNLPYDACYSLYDEVLEHCSNMKNRIAILDVHNGFVNPKSEANNPIKTFRNTIGVENLSYGVAYFPWLHTRVVSNNGITFKNMDLSLQELSNILEDNAATLITNFLITNNRTEDANDKLHKGLTAISPIYVYILNEICNAMNMLPPSAAIAGIYTSVDNSRGVWKSPANVIISNVVKPAVVITAGDQEVLNNDVISGKSINAIRSFPGRGIVVWGARTLDGNSSDWRYISVRRTMIMLEQSIKNGLESFVFEPNDSNTWIKVKNAVKNYLNILWRDGALAGAKPEDAYFVQVGLGKTMTPLDIAEGIMIVSIAVAIIRPAEFIITTIQINMTNR